MKLFRVFLITLVLAFVAAPAFAVDWNVGTDPADEFASLADAFAFLGSEPGTHTIYLAADDYTDVDLVCPTNIDAIVGGDGVNFTGSAGHNFMNIGGCAVDISDLTIDGYDRGIFGNAIGGSITGCYFINIVDYGVALYASSSGVTVADNCFNACGSPGAYDSSPACLNTWGGNYYEDATVSTYNVAGGACVDNAAVLNTFASTGGTATYNLGDIVTVDVMWNVPDCDPGSELAGYEFTVHANDTKLALVSAEFDKDYLGVDDGTDGSALYIGPTVSGSDVTFVGVNYANPGYGSARLATLTYEVIAANTSVWVQVNSDFYDAQSNLYVVETANNTLTLVDNTDPVLEYFTVDDPIGNAVFSSTYNPVFHLGATDDYNLSNVQYQWDDGAWTDWIAFTGTADDNEPGFTQSVGWADGTHKKIGFRVKDAGGNISNELFYEFDVDQAGPDFSFAIEDLDMCGNLAGYTNDSAVTVTITTTDSDIDMIKLYTPVKGWGAYSDYAAFGGTMVLDQAEIAQNAAMYLKDLYGNETFHWADATLMLDITDPPTTQDFALAGGAAKTNTLSITADVTGFNAPFYKVSTDPADLTCDQGGWLTPAHPFPVTLEGGDGFKTIYFVTMDNAGNQSPVQSDDIEVDMTAPTVTSVEMEECSNHWANNDVTITFPDGDVVWIGIRDNGSGYTWFGDGSTPMTSPYTASYSMASSPANGSDATVEVQLWDNSQPIANKGNGSTTIHWDYGAQPAITSVEMKDKTSGSSIFTNDAQVVVEFVAPDDIVQVRFSPDGSTWGNWRDKDFSGGGTVTMWYTYPSPTPAAYLPLYVEARDCAGNVVTATDMGGIIFDLTAPVITGVEINGGDLETSSTTVSVVLTVTETYPGDVELSEFADFSVSTTYPWAGSFAFDVTSGDGEKCVYARMVDRAENASNEDMYDCIDLDQTTPTGTFNIVSYNADATDGWTHQRYVYINELVLDADVEYIAFKHTGTDSNENPDVNSSTGWIAVSSLADPNEWVPAALGDFYTSSGTGMKGVSMRLMDDAGNYNAWGDITDDIMYQPATPTPAVNLTSTPIASAFLDWDDDSDVAYWMIRYSFTGEYPTYDGDGVTPLGPLYPLAPTAVTGFPADGSFLTTAASEYDFVEGPHSDVYTFSVWAFGKNGLVSTSYATVTGTNYLMGDYITLEGTPEEGTDGCLDFEHEFFNGLGLAYETSFGDAGFDALVDYTATFGSDPKGLPDPDGNILIEDLIVFAQNYAAYNCDNFFDPYAKKVASGPLAITAEMPRNVQAGSEFTVSFVSENTEGIFGYNAVFDYNSDVLDVVAVEAGAMYDNVDNPFFHRSTRSDNLDIGSVLLGTEAFAGDEMFRVTFKAKVSGPVEIEDIDLKFIDADNNAISASFEAAKTVGELPTTFGLHQNYPNPFNPTTTIEFSLPVASDYTLSIYNITGQVVETFVGSADAGVQSVAWDARNNASGIYFYKLDTGTFTDTKKMVLLK